MPSFQQVAASDLEPLTEETKKHLPNSITVYGSLACGFRYKSFDFNRTKVFAPDTPMPFFVIITGTLQMDCQSMSLYWDFTKIPPKEVKELLATLPGWNWKEDFIIYGLDKKISHLFDQIVLGEGGLGTNLTKEKVIDDSYSFSLNPNDLPDAPSLDENFYLSKLSEEDAQLVYENWTYNFLTKPNDVTLMIKMLQTSAIYLKGEETQQPVAWVLTKHQGEAGFTYTFPDYRQKGLAVAACIDLIKKHLKNGYSPHAFVAISNTPSICFHEKIGFKRASIVEWAKYSQNSA